MRNYNPNPWPGLFALTLICMTIIVVTWMVAR